MIGHDQGIVYGYNSPIYLMNFNSSTQTNMVHKLKSTGKYLDMLFYKKHQIGYLYDDQIQTTIKYDHRKREFKTVMKGQLLLVQGKLFRKDTDERYLFVRTGKNQITVVSSLMNSTNFKQIDIPKSPNVQAMLGALKEKQTAYQHEIQDFYAFGKNKLLVCCNHGYILIYEESIDQKFNLISTHQLNNANFANFSESVTCASVSINPKTQHDFLISIATKNVENRLSQLHILKFDERDLGFNLIQKNIVNFNEAEYSQDPESFFYEVLSFTDMSGTTYFYCYQRYGKNKLIIFVLDLGPDGKKKSVIEELIQLDLHRGLVGKSQMWVEDGSAWSIDSKNVVKKVCCNSEISKVVSRAQTPVQMSQRASNLGSLRNSNAVLD